MSEMLLTTMLTVALRLRGDEKVVSVSIGCGSEGTDQTRCTEFKVKSSVGNLRPFIANYGGNNPFDYHVMCQESWSRMT